MPNRYTRDELIMRAIKMAQVTQLEHHDIPNGVVAIDAYMIDWLQDILDFWYHLVPFSARVTKATLNATANTQVITLPTDFILDVRDGYIVQQSDHANSKMRLIRADLQEWINWDLHYQGQTKSAPMIYMIKGRNIQIVPTPSVTRSGDLWYYQLPAPLQSDDIPDHPSDYACIEYLRLRAYEWARVYEPGTAQTFCKAIVASMQAAGLFNEPESTTLPLNNKVHISQRGYGSTYAWMGSR